MPPRRWLFIGAGNMAASIVGGLRHAGTPPERLLLIDPEPAARSAAAERFGCATAASLDDARATQSAWLDAATSLGIVLAVKPAIVRPVCEALREAGLVDRAAFVSIAAGVRCAAIERWLGARAPLVRCMPNTPALLGLGASALFATEACDTTLRAETRALFETVGTVVELADETDLDAVTALSGSGPAYVFHLAELMSEGGVALGLDAATARTLAIRTLEGAAAMLAAGDEDPSTLRTRVTSPNGTTAAALDSFAADELGATVLRAMRAAHRRAIELGDDSASH